MSARQRPTTPLTELNRIGRAECVHVGLELDVAELPDIEMTTGFAGAPAQKDITRRLHQPMPLHDPLPLVPKGALSRVGLKHRGTCLLDLEKKRILVVGHQE